MISEVVNVSINGTLEEDLVPDIIEIEVEESIDEADVFRLRVQLRLQADGAWNYIDDDRFMIWNRVSIEAGYPGSTETIIDGYITHLEAAITADGKSYLEISGMDGSAMMDLEEKQLAWSNKKDHEIAQTVFQAHGLSYEVEDTIFPANENIATVLQSETDIRFLRRLASRNGFECYVRGGTGVFRSPNLQDPPQKILAAEFGHETNLIRLSVRVDGTPARAVTIRRLDPMEKQIEVMELSESPLRLIGEQTLSELQPSTGGSVLVKQQVTASSEEMKARLYSAYPAANQFVKVEGEIDSRSYESVLRAKKLVTIKGAGERYSGLYYVTRVKHRFSLEGYGQHFEAYRNGIGLTGDEEFSAALLPIAIAAGGSDSTISTGNRVLPAEQQGATLSGGV
jgi:phage protein D